MAISVLIAEHLVEKELKNLEASTMNIITLAIRYIG